MAGDTLMTQTYLTFPDQASFDAWHTRVNHALGYPNAETLTQAYTALEIGEDGILRAPINDQCPESLRDGLSAP